ncbi:MAG: hypothetical protein FJ388_02535, partial [Verrucomicrobia bacterium]|nr:hypothetical protein [Verrucomicrobiota bacterium]
MKQRIAAFLVLLNAVFVDATPPAATDSQFVISVNSAAWKKFGFRYPVTYVFQLPGNVDNVQVQRRDGATEPWKPLEKKTASDFFNGVECVRFDPATKKAYVSVGFGAGNTMMLRFADARSVKFDSVAKYYDGRKAAYTLSNDNWGCNPWAHPGAPWKGTTDDESDSYQASVHVCRSLHLPVTMAINSRSAGGDDCWRRMQEELDRGDCSWEPAVHGQTHPKNAAGYLINGYRQEILGCRDDILRRLRNIPYGPYVYEHILTFGYCDETILRTDAREFLFLRGFNWLDNPSSNDYVPWDKKHSLYGVGGLNTKGYDSMLEKRDPRGRYYAADVADANEAFDRVHRAGGVFYALWHPDRFRNSILYDTRPGV